jgi:hypothetical protein
MKPSPNHPNRFRLLRLAITAAVAAMSAQILSVNANPSEGLAVHVPGTQQ